MKNIDFRQILLRLQNIKSQKSLLLNIISQKIDSLIVVDISHKLTLLSLDIKAEMRIDAFESIELPGDKKDETIVNAILDFIKANNIVHKNAIIKPLLNSFLIKRIQLPAVPESELVEAIKWHIKEDVSFDLSDAVIDFSIIKKTTKEDGSKVLDIICAIAKEQEVKSQVLLLKQLGFSCLSVGIEPFGYEKIVAKYLNLDKDDSLGLLHLTETICYFTVYKNNKLEFYRELPLSINKLKESLRGVLVSEKGRIELSAEEVDEVLFKIGAQEEETIYKEKLSSSRILSMLRPILERLCVEIRRSLSYYDSEFSGGMVKKILITGAALNIPSIDKFLAKELSLDIKKISLKDKLIISSTINQEKLSESYASLGLVLDYNKGINLLPYEFRTEKFEKLEKISLRWIAFIAFLLLVISYLFAKAGVRGYQRRLDNTLVNLNVLSEVREIKTRTNQLNNFTTDVRNLEPSIGTILKKLSNIAGRDLFFNNFLLNVESKTGEILGVIKSVRQNPDSILTKFIRDLENSGYFIDVNIASVNKSKQQLIDITEFKIVFKLP